ncbi:YfhO family protein [Alicyclobacillus sp. SO9]|nr:YfhO family protein [Alicyclobacillus sp. SO9]
MTTWASRCARFGRRHGFFLLITIVLVVLSYPAWIHTGVPGTDDLSNLNIPQRQLLKWFYDNGRWPLWNPFNFGGQPLLAAGQSGPLYLPNIVFVLFPIVFATKLSYVLHEILLAVGMYALSWHVSRHRVAAVLGAVCFADSGFLVGHQIHTQMFDAMSWLPLIFLLFLRLHERFTRRRFVFLGLAFAMEVFAGHPQITFYTALFVVLYAALMWLWSPSFQALKRWFFTLTAFALGGLLASAQLIPTLQLVSYSDRADVSKSFLLLGSLPWSGLLQLLLPFAAGGGYTSQPFTVNHFETLYYIPNFWEFLSYAGIVFLIAAIATACWKFIKDRTVRTLAVIGVFTLLLALGSNTVFSHILTDVPVFNLFRVPARYVGLTDFSLAILAAIGFAQLLQASSQRTLRVLITSTVSVLIVVLLGVRWIGPYVKMTPAGFWVPLTLLVLLLLIIVVSFAVPDRAKSWLGYGLAVIAVVDLVSQTYSMSQFVEWEQGHFRQPTPLQKFISTHLSGPYPFSRVASLGTNSLMLDRSAINRIPSINGYDSLVADWYVRDVNLTWRDRTFLSEPRQFINALGVEYIVTGADAGGLTSSSQGVAKWMHWLPRLKNTSSLRIVMGAHHTVIDAYAPLFSVTLQSGSHYYTEQISGWPAPSYVIPIPKTWPKTAATKVTITSQSWQGTFNVKTVQLFTSHGTVSYNVNRTFGARVWKKVADFNGVTVWKNPNPLYAAWVTSPNDPLHPDYGTAKLKAWTPNQQSWTVNAGHSGEFVLSQTYDPNWEATVDGKKTPVTRISSMLTAVHVSRGKHVITLNYKPRSFQAGLGISLITLLFSVILLLDGSSVRNMVSFKNKSTPRRN